MSSDMIFTSESVTPGHPDKLCDRISDAAVDALLREDESARAVVECALATGVVFLAARYAAEARVDLPSLARKVIAEAGYASEGFDARTCSILTNLAELPLGAREPEPAPGDEETIARRVAQQQANVFGYACRDTAQLMPAPIVCAHKIARALDEARRARFIELSPDAKTQVSVEYRGARAVRIHSLSLTVAVDDESKLDAGERLRALALDALGDTEIRPDERTQIIVNAAAVPLEIGGPARHAGLTGRKNGIDSYGEIARMSGSALSGKDPSRIDRSGAYAARYAAKNIVAAGLAERCEVLVSYAIGQAQPLSLSVETYNTGKRSDAEIGRRLAAAMDFRPAAIIRRFRLRSRLRDAGPAGFYLPLATFGHFGRDDLDLPWEATDLAEVLRG
ncbi:methionine adenosyltransferase [Methylocystis parvus]|uniref:Methionine adenosyltransferase n=1 Tax=Methylocystis parvus TaxID=134 RepID=A0A6B8M8X8_9HYPH|nr:methionine adenosyltransferase [Methylocystis parvus]QGM97753.1 methionine adenosyltransferase [Methylocystis parvus]WBK01942.1 methionine adenosyltransferase [Methylocystis parvus OBBP]